jgi:hypothetical protein
MARHVQLTASVEILDDQDAEAAAAHYSQVLLEAVVDHPAATRVWVSTLVSDQPLPRPDLAWEVDTDG